MSHIQLVFILGKEKDLEDLRDEESEEEFVSDEELADKEEDGWGEREFVSDDSELEELEDDDDMWNLDDMGLEKVREEDSEEVNHLRLHMMPGGNILL